MKSTPRPRPKTGVRQHSGDISINVYFQTQINGLDLYRKVLGALFYLPVMPHQKRYTK